MAYVIAFYEIDLAYGGPEEGGWWFETGQIVRTHRVVKNEEHAFEICRRANRLLAVVQKDARDVSSVLYSGGRIVADVFKDAAPAFYPKHRPHYE